jgi:hypothetical protein
MPFHYLTSANPLTSHIGGPTVGFFLSNGQRL